MNNGKGPPDRLADRLDGLLAGGQGALPASDDDPVVDAALRLANASHPEMPPDVLAHIQAQVVRAHQRQQVRQRSLRQRTAPLLRLAAAIAVLIVFLGLGVIPAAASSVPGDLLYPLKRGLEQIELALAFSPAARATAHLHHAESRLDEAQTLLERGQFDDVLFAAALDSLTQSAAAARQDASAAPWPELEARTLEVNAGLDAVLEGAARASIVPPDAAETLASRLQAARERGDLLLPASTSVATVTPAPSPTATTRPIGTPTPTHTAMPTLTPVPGGASTARPTRTPPSPTPFRAVISAAGNVNIRSGPGTGFDVVATAQPGERVQVIDQHAGGSWQRVRLGDGREGWIATGLLTPGDVPEVIPSPTTAPEGVPAEGGAPDCALSESGCLTPTVPGGEGAGHEDTPSAGSHGEGGADHGGGAGGQGDGGQGHGGSGQRDGGGGASGGSGRGP